MKPEKIFEEASLLPVSERSAFLEKACGGDDALRRAVEQQLSDVHDATIVPQSAAIEPDATVVPDTNDPALSPTKTMPTASSAVGQQIGPYKLLQALGEGGMGTVYMAEQREPVQRRVALKIIKAGMDSGQVVARFEAERQALAMMDHPNIARVLDAGATESGSPYFVMELVKGTPITDFCDRNKLNIRQRLELFVDVCSAVQHAHQKGIIHRDLKPSNILVTMHDDKPVPKVIDFGVAKATSQRLTEKTMFTAYGQVVGTLEYMSPEQAQMTDLDVDTRSDIYSLGVLLYELLTGSTPLKRESLREAAFLEILKRIKEEEPQRPSTRISESREALDNISAVRQVEPKRFSLLMKGDLDWIVLKSLEKDRTRRYETANAFSADVKRFLSDEPIEARPPSAMYRFQKLARKNRLLFGFAGTVAALLLIGIGVSAYLASWAMSEATTAKAATETALAETVKTQQALTLAEERRVEAETQQREAETQRNEANRQKTEADAAAKRAEAILDVVVSSFRSVDPNKQDYLTDYAFPVDFGSGESDPNQSVTAVRPAGAEMKASEVLVRAQESLDIDNALRNDPRGKAKLLFAVSCSFLGLGDRQRALQAAERCLELRKAELGDDHPDTMQALELLGICHSHLGGLSGALELFGSVYQKEQSILGEDHPSTLKTCNWLAAAYRAKGDTNRAIKLLEQTLEKQRSILGEDHPSTLTTVHNLAFAYSHKGDTDRAIELFKQILEKQRSLLGEDHPSTLVTAHNLAAAYRTKGDTDRAIELLEQTLEKKQSILGEDHPDTLTTGNSLGVAYGAKGDTASAIKLLEQTLEKQRSILGEDHLDTLTTVNNLAVEYTEKGDTDKAIELLEQTLEKRRLILGEDHPRTLMTGHSLAAAYCAKGDTDRAIELFKQMLEKRRSILGEDHLDTLTTVNDLAVAYQAQGNNDRAIELFKQILEKQRSLLGEDHPSTLTTVHNLAFAYSHKGDTDRAIELFKQILEKQRSLLGEDHPSTLRTGNSLAAAYRAKGDTDRAIELLEQTLKKQRSVLGEDRLDTLTTVNNLAFAYQAQGNNDRAIELLEKQRSILREDHPYTLTTVNNLAIVYEAHGDKDRAIELLESILEKRRKVLGETHTDTLGTANFLLHLYKSTDSLAQGIELSQALYNAQVVTQGRLDSRLLEYLNALTNMRHKLTPSRIVDSTADLLATAEAFGSQTKSDEKFTEKVSFGHLLAFASEALLDLGRFEQSEQLARHCIRLREETSPDEWFVPFSKCALAGALMGQGKSEEAEVVFADAYSELERRIAHRGTRMKALLWGTQIIEQTMDLNLREQYLPQLRFLTRQQERGKRISVVNTAREKQGANPLHTLIDFEDSLRQTLQQNPDDVPTRVEACFYSRYMFYQSLNQAESPNLESTRKRIIADLKWFRDHAPNGHKDPLLNNAELELHYVFGITLVSDDSEWSIEQTADRIKTLVTKATSFGQSEACQAFKNIAWKASTSAEESDHNGPLAVELATIACDFCTAENKAQYLDTLAAARARNGDFDKAVETMKQALSADANGMYTDQFQERLKLFESGQPYTEPAKTE